MTKLNQKNAVYAAITNVLAENNIHFEDGMDIKPIMTKELRAEVSTILLAGFQSQTIELDRAPYETESEWKSYVSGLISNWIKKDKRFNGNVKHEPKNPGSRFGAADEQLKALKALMTTVNTDADRKEIQGYIDQRLAQLKAEAAKTVTVNLADLPPELQAKYAPQAS